MVDTVVDVMLNAGLRSEPIQTLFHRLQRRNPDSPCGLGQQKKKQIHEESPCHEGFGRTLGSKGSDLDLGYHFQAAVTICLAHRQNLCNKSA